MTENSRGHAVAVILETPEGIPLVSDPAKPAPRFWKFPGGRNEPGETPLATAVREFKEEIGVELRAEELKLVHQETRGSGEGEHQLFLFRASLTKKIQPAERDGGGEMVKLFSLAEIKNLPDFFPNHRALAEKIGLFAKSKWQIVSL